LGNVPLIRRPRTLIGDRWAHPAKLRKIRGGRSIAGGGDA